MSLNNKIVTTILTFEQVLLCAARQIFVEKL